MKLEKDYIDLIDAEGNCFILYWAQLTLLGLPIRYAGIIYSNTLGITQESSQLFVGARPNSQNNLWFAPRGLGFTVQVTPQAEAIDSNLYTDAKGRVLRWHCHHPKAAVVVNYLGKEYKGLGYAETITIPMPPWQLPIQTLRWGRFLSANYTLVWIEWEGAHPLHRVWLNGISVPDAVITAEGIDSRKENFCLTFSQPVIIRKGKLEKVIEKYPWLRLFFTQRILQTVETKYKSKATFSNAKHATGNGWALYETVILAKSHE